VPPRHASAYLPLQLPSLYEWGVMLLRNLDAALTQQERNPVQRYASKQAFNRNSVAKHMRMTALWHTISDLQIYRSEQQAQRPLPCFFLRYEDHRCRSKKIAGVRIRKGAILQHRAAALRHTFLTEAGEYTDLFTLQYVAGHDNIKTTMRYVHPREDAVEKLFARLGNLPRPETRVECKRSVQNPVQSELPLRRRSC
jgi:integrase